MTTGRIPSIEGGIQPTIVDAKGDIITATAADTPARLAVGTNGQLLSADSTTATGLAWTAAPSSGGMTLLSTTTLSGSTTTISSIDQTYVNLFVTVEKVNPSAQTNLRLYPNNNSTNNVRLTLSGATGDSFQADAVANSDVRLNAGSRDMASGNTDNFFAINIPDYASTNHIKITQWFGSFRGSVPDDVTVLGSSGLRGSNSAISSLVFALGTGTFNGGVVKVYGVK
jgi:hypothetical protein